jgi:hemolysin activation/secretion protein
VRGRSRFRYSLLAERRWSPRAGTLLALLLLSAAAGSVPAKAQTSGFDPRQTEKRFDTLESGQTQPARSGLHMPALTRPGVAADTKPLFKLRGVLLTGARAIPREQITRTYQPYLGKTVSQADLAAIAAAVSDLYRAAGFHLTLQLPFMQVSESMGNHDSKIVDAASVD